MNTQEEIQYYRNTERRHMIEVKDALGHGVPRLAEGDTQDLEFVLACVEYLGYILNRFVRQGHANMARLREVVPDDDADDQRILADIEDTLDDTYKQIESLISVTGEFQSGDIDLDKFKDACEHFLNYYNTVLAQRKNPAQEIIQKHIDENTYWQNTNDVTDEGIETEQAMFGKIKRLTPTGLQFSDQ